MYDYFKNIYTKVEKFPETYEIGLNIAITKWLSKDSRYIGIVKRVLSYIYSISPKHYYWLLFLSIPRATYPPKMVKTEREEKTAHKPLFKKIQYVLKWSDRELNRNMPMLEKLIIPNKKYWEQELGVK